MFGIKTTRTGVYVANTYVANRRDNTIQACHNSTFRLYFLRSAYSFCEYSGDVDTGEARTRREIMNIVGNEFLKTTENNVRRNDDLIKRIPKSEPKLLCLMPHFYLSRRGAAVAVRQATSGGLPGRRFGGVRPVPVPGRSTFW